MGGSNEYRKTKIHKNDKIWEDDENGGNPRTRMTRLKKTMEEKKRKISHTEIVFLTTDNTTNMKIKYYKLYICINLLTSRNIHYTSTRNRIVHND